MYVPITGLKVRGLLQAPLFWWHAMRRFLTTGAHLGAMRDFHRVGTGKTCRYETEAAPDWEAALAYWREHGREY